MEESVTVLLDPEETLIPEAHERLERRRQSLRRVRRQSGRPAAEALRALPLKTFDKLGALERGLLRRYYGIGQQQPWTRRELAQAYSLSPTRVENIVNAAVGVLVGAELRPRFDRVCAVAGGTFTVTSRVIRKQTCGDECARRLKSEAGMRTRRTAAPQ